MTMRFLKARTFSRIGKNIRKVGVGIALGVNLLSFTPGCGPEDRFANSHVLVEECHLYQSRLGLKNAPIKCDITDKGFEIEIQEGKVVGSGDEKQARRLFNYLLYGKGRVEDIATEPKEIEEIKIARSMVVQMLAREQLHQECGDVGNNWYELDKNLICASAKELVKREGKLLIAVTPEELALYFKYVRAGDVRKASEIAGNFESVDAKGFENNLIRINLAKEQVGEQWVNKWILLAVAVLGVAFLRMKRR